jgi:hypothetical protein
MTDRRKQALKQQRRSSSQASALRRAVSGVLALLAKTDSGVRRVGATAAAVMAIVALAVFVLGVGKSTRAPSAEASIGEVGVEPGVLLEQYEYNNPPAATASTSAGSPTHAGYRLAVDSANTPARAAIYLTDAQTSTENTSTEGTSTQGTSTEGTSTEGTSTVETPAERDAREAAQAKAREQARAREAAKAREAAQTREALAKEARIEEEAKIQEERGRAQARAEEAKAKVRARGRQETQAQLEEEDRLLARDAAKIEREEREEDSLRASKHKRAAGGSSVRQHQSYAAPPLPPPPATQFHRSGDAKILVGTGAPTSKVDAVLGKAKAILARRAAAFARADAAFGAEQPVFRDVSTGEPSETLPPASRTASNVPATCASTCGLRPTIDQAIADYSANLAEAARAVAAAFSESRDEIFEHKVVPVGVTVNYSLDLVGFAGKRMVLEWTLCSSSTERPLPRTWWRNVIVKQIVPSSNAPTRVPGNFWAPIPATRGDYYFRLRVFEGGSEHTNRVTEAFH